AAVRKRAGPHAAPVTAQAMTYTCRAMSSGPLPVDRSLLADKIRRVVIEQSWRARTGHIGSCLSVADLIAALLGGVLHAVGPDDPERDRLILSKGHAGLALYAGLHATGRLDAEGLDTFYGDGSLLGVH